MLEMTALDWGIIGAVFMTTMLLGILVGLKSGKNRESFFLGGRSLPWWLLGTSMVATTFSTDTPNLVTDLVRGHGVFGNWAWWCFLPTGMTTVFLYAKLWRRLGAVTDMEFYEIRYSGRAAGFLRGFRAVYLGLFFNVMTMGAVSLAAIKIGAAMLGLTPVQSVCYAMAATVLFTSIGGFRGVIFTDFLLFFLAMVGAIAAAFFAVNLPEVGGIGGMLGKFAASPELSWKISPAAWGSTDDLIAFIIVPFTITWWSIWYPGAEPGGGGFLVQRMMAAKNEKHSMAAVMFFNVAHYALRPWPWIIVALASLIVYPDLASIQRAVGHLLPASQCGHDTAYSLMLSKMPAGWLGLMVASLMAAYMSTLSTLLNWGSSYCVNDVWKRFIRPDAGEKELVWCGRAVTLLLMVLSALLALQLQNAMQTFQLLLSIGAGTGLLFLLRWFWWRINAACEIAAMAGSFFWAAVFFFWKTCPLSQWQQMAVAVALTTLCWLPFAWIGPKTDFRVLREFCRKINPGGAWRAVFAEAERQGDPIVPEAQAQDIPRGLLASLFGCFAVYLTMFATGKLIYGDCLSGTVCLVAALAFALLLVKVWNPSRKASDDCRIVQNVPGYNSWSFIQPVNGKLICAYSRGLAHTIGNSDRGVYARTSADGGRTWSDETAVCNSPDSGDVATGKGLDGQGNLLLWVRCVGKSWHHELYRSADGIRFQRIAELRLDPMPIQITDVFSVPGIGLMSLWFAGSYSGQTPNAWGTLVSTDNGLTWKQTVIETGLSKSDWPTEPSAVYLGDGRILAIARVEGDSDPSRAQFQLESMDSGKTWKRFRTNITDVMESTPSLIYDSVAGRVYNYYYQRGAGQLKCRTAPVQTVWDDPRAWPAPKVAALGSTKRHHAGNVNAAIYRDRHCLTFYSGDEHNTAVLLKLVRPDRVV